jgi:hypothetical protein
MTAASNIVYMLYSIIHLPISISLMLQPRFLTSILFDAPIYDSDYSSLLLLDAIRIMGCYVLFFACFTFFMITVRDRRTRNIFHLAMGIKCVALCGVLLSVILFSQQHKWLLLGKWSLFVYYLLGFIVFVFLWWKERRGTSPIQQDSTSRTLSSPSPQPFYSTLSTTPTPSDQYNYRTSPPPPSTTTTTYPDYSTVRRRI